MEDEWCEMSCVSCVRGTTEEEEATEEAEEEEEEEEEEEPGVSDQKQKPHTKMWGIKKSVLSFAFLAVSLSLRMHYRDDDPSGTAPKTTLYETEPGMSVENAKAVSTRLI